MVDYEKLYHLMFNAATDSLNELARRNYGLAESMLEDAQKQCEELYIAEA